MNPLEELRFLLVSLYDTEINHNVSTHPEKLFTIDY